MSRPCRKVRHRRESHALLAIDSMVVDNVAETGALAPYYCDRCRAWHVGHRRNWSKISPQIWAAIERSLDESRGV